MARERTLNKLTEPPFQNPRSATVQCNLTVHNRLMQ